MLFNVTQHPTAQWTWRQVIQATPWGSQPPYILRDHGACFGKAAVANAKEIGMETIPRQCWAPKDNAIAGRLVGTFRRECRGHVIVASERDVTLDLC